MLKRISLRDFQKHHKRNINLDERVTVIVGPTDSGKSSFIRAFRLVFLNKPSGKRFIRKKAKSKRAKIEVDIDGHTITRIRGSSNVYKLDKQTFKAFGGGKVPDEIIKLANISDLNFQGQIDTPFWFTLAPGQISKKLNEVLNLGDIDKVTARAAKLVREHKSDHRHTKERLRKAKQEKAKLEWVHQVDRELKRLEASQDQLEVLDELVKDLAERIARTSDLKSELKQLRSAEDNSVLLLKKIERLTAQSTQIDKLDSQCTALEQSIKSIEAQEQKLCQVKQSLKLASTRLGKIRKCPVCERKW